MRYQLKVFVFEVNKIHTYTEDKITTRPNLHRDHLHASLVLVIDGYPFTKALASTPFGLFSREKKSEKRQENFNVSTANNISTNNTISQSLHLKDFFQDQLKHLQDTALPTTKLARQ